MHKQFIPYEYQKLMMRHIAEHKRCALWVFMGGGKTSAVLTALNGLNLLKPVFPALILAPVRVARSTWPDEVEKWEHLAHLKVSPIVGDYEERMKALHTKADIYTTNYEQIEWLVELYGKKWPFRTIVADESTRLKSFRIRQGGKRAGALYQVSWLDKVERFIELTGTPAPNGLIDLHGQVYFLDQGERLGRSFQAFTDRWFRPGWNNSGYRALPHAKAEIEAKLRGICLSIVPEDWFDLEEPVVRKVYVDLPPEARKKYDDMEKEMFVTLDEDTDVEAFNAASKRMKCLQLGNGAAYVGEDNTQWIVTHDEKIEALKSIVEEAAGMPILVAYHFKSDLARLQKAFKKARVLDKDPKTIKEWNQGKISMLLAHPASCGHGLNLQDGGNILVYFTCTDNLENHQQILERIGPMRQKQAGHDRNVFVYYIIAKNTVEHYAILPNLEGKGELQDLLMQAMKERKE